MKFGSDKIFFAKNKIFWKYDFVEISSIIKNLDLVISVDTAICIFLLF